MEENINETFVVTEFGGPEVMKYMDFPKPVPYSKQVLIRVESTSVNFADI
jgi:NADPH:quinone reductase